MASDATHLLTKHFHSLSSAARADGLPDRELVQRFAARRDDEAFAALVRRHGPMVLRVCQRVLRDAHTAEDAFQAVFLVLSRKVTSLRRADSVGCWLHGVAYRLALKARTQLARQHKHEGRAVTEKYTNDPLTELSVREAQAIVEEELARLPENYRAPLVLCCLEGQTRDEAARQLGWSTKLLKSRLEQGRERLRFRLSRRGLTLPTAMAATLLAEEVTLTALPAALVRAAVQTARAWPANAVAPSVALLAEDALGGMGTAKAKVVVALLLLMGMLATGMGVFALAQPAAKEDETPPAAKASEPPKDEKPQPVRTLRVVVLDPRGKPLPEAKVHSSIWTHENGFKANHDYKTDAEGAAQVELPKTFYILRLWASNKPFVPLFANWEQNELASGEKLPAEYVFRMERAVTAGGRIVDEQDKPIAGVRVQVELKNNQKLAHGDGRTSFDRWLAWGNDAVTTDAEGRWRIDNVPDHPQVKLTLLVSHPDYVSVNYGRGEEQKAAGITTEMLRKGTATLTLKRGVRVRGRVTDPTGKPIKDALVIYGDDSYIPWLPCKFPTDADGWYRLPALPPVETTLTVIATSWAPQLRKVNLRPGMPPQDFRMAAGKPIRLRIVDAAGKPVPKAYVSILGWKGSKSLRSNHNPNHPKVPDPKFPRRANADGIWEWTWAPDDAVKLQISSEGFASRELEIAGGAERTVVLGADRITGRVTDATTGKPIPAFTVIQLDVFRKDWFVAERNNAVAGQNGRLDFRPRRTDIPLRLRVEAPGYRTQDGPEFRVGDDTSRTQDFRLQPSAPVAGVVRDANGQPVAKAEVLLATPTGEVQLSSQGLDNNHKTFTDAGGRFAFPDPGEPFLVVAQADAGFALAEFAGGQHDAGTLRLRPWASIRGRFREGGKPVRGATILLDLIRIDALDRPRIHTVMLQTVTDADGRFELSRVPPVPVIVGVHLGPWKDEGFRSGPSAPLDLKPGQRAELALGGGGTVVKGKVKLTGKVPADLDCTYSLNYLVQRVPGIDPPPEIARLGFDARNGWQETWTQTMEGRAFFSTLRHWFVKLAPDGAFRISGVPPGEYDLAVAVYAKPSGCLVDPLARKVVRVTVTAADAARGELMLPEVAAVVAPVPAVGDTPALTFQRADGTDGTLKDCHGRYTVVHFWASWCGPCKQQLPALRRLHERFAGHKLATIGLALDHDASAWRTALKRLDLPWPQGRLADAADAGVSSVPTYWLLDPHGKIVAKVYDPDELATLLAKRLK
ncbi:MAG TPA: sigma-70 family RNA polymerase sigma factor [Gemmataceae bacterium]|jgi:RNA polymerase sigma factor (sigma-70 family)